MKLAMKAGITILLTSTTLSAGSYTFYANSTDPVGNISECSSANPTPASVAYVLDLTAGAITNVTAVSNGTYTTGGTFTISVVFSKVVNVTGAPVLALTTGQASQATYSSGTGSDTLVFAYTVASGDNSSDLTYTATNSLTLAGGTIKDNASNADFRIVVGTAVYTSSFSPPTSALATIANTKLFLKFINAGIYDAHASNTIETVGNSQVNTGTTKFSPSLSFDGTGDWLILPASKNFELGTGDYTVEVWINPAATQTATWYPYVFGSNTPWSAGGGFGMFYNTGTGVVDSTPLYFAASGVTILLTTHGALKATWTHLAIQRSSGTMEAFVNGISVGTIAQAAAIVNTSIMIGGVVEGGSYGNHPFTGYIEDFRLTKGRARYSGNFTPPTATLPIQ